MARNICKCPFRFLLFFLRWLLVNEAPNNKIGYEVFGIFERILILKLNASIVLMEGTTSNLSYCRLIPVVLKIIVKTIEIDFASTFNLSTSNKVSSCLALEKVTNIMTIMKMDQAYQ